VFVANRTTAGIVAAMQVLVPADGVAVGLSAGYSHPAVHRAVRLAGGRLDDVRDTDSLGDHLAGADVLILTRLAVTYEALSAEDLRRAVELAGTHGVPVFVDDAGGARVGPAVLGQPRMLELGAVAGVTGLDKYGTAGPRLGLVGGRTELVARIRARAIELGLDAADDAVLLVEWPERAGENAWRQALRLSLDFVGAGARRLTAQVPPAWEGRWPPQ
jgi:L-seryl-tRNA(Ser) seleniumtransferase